VTGAATGAAVAVGAGAWVAGADVAGAAVAGAWVAGAVVGVAVQADSTIVAMIIRLAKMKIGRFIFFTLLNFF
jgi:hypothetical protein